MFRVWGFGVLVFGVFKVSDREEGPKMAKISGGVKPDIFKIT